MRKLIFALAVGAILIPSYGFTLGLGEIEVNSSLNQKLTARIDLISAAPEDAESLIIKLASRKEFVRAGLDRPMVLGSLKFKTSVDAGKVYIEVLSPKPIREPFLNFLVEVDWPQGHLIREYTILLDPPVFMGGQQRAAAAPVIGRPAIPVPAGSVASDTRPSAMADFRPSAQPSRPAESVVTAPVAREAVTSQPIQPQRYAAPGYTAPAPSYTPPAGHRVQKGDTAWSIANRTKPDSVSTQQMLIAMLRANPEVFIDGNVNGLKRGRILRTPDYAAINAVSNEEAMAAVRQQNTLWREYQQSLASDQPAPAIDEKYTETKPSPAVGVTNDESRLSIVSAGSGSSASGEMTDAAVKTANKLREQLSLAREQVETERVEKEALQQQIDALSAQVEKMKSLLIINNDAMAEMQAAETLANEKALTQDKPAEAATVEETVEKVVEQVVEEEAVTKPSETIEDKALDALDALADLFKDEPTAEEDLQQLEAAGEETLDLEAPAEELFVDETGAAEQPVDAEILSEQALLTEQEMLSEMEPAYTPPQEVSLVETLLNNKMVLGGLLVVLLVIGAIVYLVKRRRKNASGGSGEASDELKKNDGAGLDDVSEMLDDAFLDDLVSDEQIEAAKAASAAEAQAGLTAKPKAEEFDADATMVLPSGTNTAADTVVTPAANLQPAKEEEEQDDVLAEADVYLAYGIYQQAEELLENAIKANPDKDSYRVKLAETYFAGKNAEAFAKLGVEMKQHLGNEETPAWSKVAAMGKELCPDEAVFQQSGSDAELDVNDLMPKSPEPMDLDLGGEDASALDLDFDSSADAALEMPSMDETAVIPQDETVVMSPDASESLDELEFDLSETDAIEESPLEEPAAEEEFSLDIEESELDMGLPAAAESSDAELDMGLDMGLDISMDAEPESTDDGMDFELDLSAAADDELDMSVSTDELDLSAAEGELDMSLAGDELDLSAAEDELDMSLGADELDLSAAEDELEMSLSGDELDLSASEDELEMSLAADELDLSAAEDELEMSLAADELDLSAAGEELDMSGGDELDVTAAVDDLDLPVAGDESDLTTDDEEEIDLTEDVTDLGSSTDNDFAGVDLSEPLDEEEVNTKLDLSRAYLDMGDHDGAKDILQEVIAGGNAEQKKEAEELMAQAT